MFLLRPLTVKAPHRPVNKFTFQYVSIKTAIGSFDCVYLISFTFQYVSIKTKISNNHGQIVLKFTFQYVSIKTNGVSLTVSNAM